jgi:UDPglucose--hexose-1-phosphate uridylyltransferase
MPELRQDPLSGRWVVIASGRAKRPEAFAPAERPLPLADHDPACAFCPGQEGTTPPEVLAYRDPGTAADGPGWQVRVVTNKFAAFDAADAPPPPDGHSLEQRRAARGTAEVIIETPSHNRTLARASHAERARMIQGWLDRYRILSAWPDTAYVLLFRNQGAWAGASQIHPHSQIMALPMIPPAVTAELEHAEAHLAAHGRCLLCDVIALERTDGRRIVHDDGDYLVLSPYAARTPFELMILPARHHADLATIAEADAEGLARALGLAMDLLNRALGDPPYNLYLHAAPPERPETTGRWADSVHWHLTILPRLTQPAGFELGSGVLVNITLPEAATAFLRSFLPD